VKRTLVVRRRTHDSDSIVFASQWPHSQFSSKRPLLHETAINTSQRCIHRTYKSIYNTFDPETPLLPHLNITELEGLETCSPFIRIATAT
jgi:hypothetical protein